MRVTQRAFLADPAAEGLEKPSEGEMATVAVGLGFDVLLFKPHVGKQNIVSSSVERALT